VGQALALAAEHPPDGESLALAPRQHYATFMLELLLDEENHVRRTRVAHIQGAAEESWAGWRAEQLLAFFGQQAQLQDAPAEPPHPAPPVEEICPGAALHIRALELAPEGEDGTRSFVGHGQPFELRLSLALDAAAAVKPWQYDATVYAKSLDSHSRAPSVRHRARCQKPAWRLCGWRAPGLRAASTVLRPRLASGRPAPRIC
jgi:hypothetical protein